MNEIQASSVAEPCAPFTARGPVRIVRQKDLITPRILAEVDVLCGVIAYIALTGGHGNDGGTALWRLAEAAGWTLEEFVAEVVAHTGGAEI